MTQDEFINTIEELLSRAKAIRDEKSPAYTQGNKDILKRIKSDAKEFDLLNEKVWGIFFGKHIAALKTWAKNPKAPQSEPIEERFADALNFLFMGYALHKETTPKEVATKITKDFQPNVLPSGTYKNIETYD